MLFAMAIIGLLVPRWWHVLLAAVPVAAVNVAIAHYVNAEYWQAIGYSPVYFNQMAVQWTASVLYGFGGFAVRAKV